jgi:hypothetical protein
MKALSRVRNFAVAVAAGVLAFAGYAPDTKAADCSSYGTVQAIIAAGNSCTIGDKTFSGFSVTGDLNATQVNIAAVVNGPDFWGFTFQFDLTASIVAGGGDPTNDFLLIYDVTCTDGSACIDSVHADITGTVAPPGAVGIGTLAEQYLPGQQIDLCFGVAGCVSSATVDISPVSSLHLIKDLNVQCLAPATASGICSITMSALTNTVDQVEVPEPGTLALFAGGLLAMGWVGRRRRNNS